MVVYSHLTLDNLGCAQLMAKRLRKLAPTLVTSAAYFTEELQLEIEYGRPPRLKIFLSSRMADGSLKQEREAAYKAINVTRIAKAWAWEWSSRAGPYSTSSVCLGQARTSDGLVLLLGGELSEITRKEYEVAYSAGKPCYIFVKDGVEQSEEVRAFIKQERDKGCVTRIFRTLPELRTEITEAIYTGVSLAHRRENERRRRQRLHDVGSQTGRVHFSSEDNRT